MDALACVCRRRMASCPIRHARHSQRMLLRPNLLPKSQNSPSPTHLLFKTSFRYGSCGRTLFRKKKKVNPQRLLLKQPRISHRNFSNWNNYSAERGKIATFASKNRRRYHQSRTRWFINWKWLFFSLSVNVAASMTTAAAMINGATVPWCTVGRKSKDVAVVSMWDDDQCNNKVVYSFECFIV